jgi:hypothetical protein
MGAEARPLFNWATDLSSIFKDYTIPSGLAVVKPGKFLPAAPRQPTRLVTAVNRGCWDSFE